MEIALNLLSVKNYKMMIDIEKELIINIPRTEVEGFEATEKKTRPKQLSVKKVEARKASKKNRLCKINTIEIKLLKEMKTKLLENRN
jgi:ATP-dependent RNA helicase RhlE